MAQKKNNKSKYKSGRPNRAAGPAAKSPAPAEATTTKGVIPDAPPMADNRPRWPLYVALAILALWLIGLTFLALHSTQWIPG